MGRGGACQFVNNTINFTHCTFKNNAAAVAGGAIDATILTNSYLSSSTFKNNMAGYGGAVYCSSNKWPSLVVKKCSFNGNTAAIGGGALYVNNTSVNISFTEYSNNTASEGTTIYFSGMCVMKIHQSRFIQNGVIAHSLPDHASSIYAIYGSNVLISNTAFHNNTGGGAIILFQTRGEIHHCSFCRNFGVIGGAIATNRSPHVLVITHTSFIGNRAPFGAAMGIRNRNTLVQSCHFDENVAFEEPNIISALEAMDLRFYKNVFCEPTSGNSLPLKSVIHLDSPLPNAMVYLWNTSYQFSRNKIALVDKSFLYNKSMPKIFTVLQGGNCSQVFSQFASGEKK